MKKRKRKKRRLEQHSSGWAIGCMLGMFIFFTVAPILYCGGLATKDGLLALAQQVMQSSEEEKEKEKKVEAESKENSKSKSKSNSQDESSVKNKDPSKQENSSPKGPLRTETQEKFTPWADYKIAAQSEKGQRLVNGRKHSITYKILINPRETLLPNDEQLEEISTHLCSDNHVTTYVHFFVPGMDLRRGAWATAHHMPDEPFAVYVFNRVLPDEFQAK